MQAGGADDGIGIDYMGLSPDCDMCILKVGMKWILKVDSV